MSAPKRITLDDGKYAVENHDGILKFWRHGEPWGGSNLSGAGVVLAMVQEIERLQEASETPAPQAVAGKAIDALLAAVEFAHEALWAIATKQRMFGDTLEPIHNIAKASALARAAYDRLHPPFMAYAHLTPSPAPSAAPHQGADALREAGRKKCSECMYPNICRTQGYQFCAATASEAKKPTACKFAAGGASCAHSCGDPMCMRAAG